jgi:NADH:ubiquinone oxidoreductase subunit
MVNIGMYMRTLLKGVYVGKDIFGNRYYYARGNNMTRWVWYAGKPEPSSVPPLWHAWLHGMVSDVPEGACDGTLQYDWMLPAQPNYTGTAQAYYPQGWWRGGKRTRTTGDYEAWVPPAR